MAFKDYILHNLRWKVAALVVAVFGWFSIQVAIRQGEGEFRVLVVPAQSVNVLKSGSDSSLYRIEPAAVDVIIRSSVAGIRALERDTIEVFVDLTEAPVDTGVIREVLVHAPRGIEVVRTEPKAVFVERSSSVPGPITESVIQP